MQGLLACHANFRNVHTQVLLLLLLLDVMSGSAHQSPTPMRRLLVPVLCCSVPRCAVHPPPAGREATYFDLQVCVDKVLALKYLCKMHLVILACFVLTASTASSCTASLPDKCCCGGSLRPNATSVTHVATRHAHSN